MVVGDLLGGCRSRYNIDIRIMFRYKDVLGRTKGVLVHACSRWAI